MAKVKKINKLITEPVKFAEIKQWYNTYLHPSVFDFDDPEPFKVYEEGRWAGIFQCVDEFTQVLTPKGEKAISKLLPGDEVITFTGDDMYPYVTSTISNVFDQGIKDCIELRFDNGQMLTCTYDHLILTDRGWVEAGKLSSDDNVISHMGLRKAWPTKENVGPRHVFDIEVPVTHNFIANGVVVHNCTGQGAQRLFMKAKPKSVIDIAALTSIYRPGPLAADVDKLWMKHEHEYYDWGHPLINETLKDTRGLLVFQEGVMALVNKVSGFPLAETDEVRRAIMKRSISGGEAAKKKMKELEDSIINGAIGNGVPREIAEKMYETVCWMSGYGFNKSLYFCEIIPTYLTDGTFDQNKTIQDIIPGDIVRSRNESNDTDVFIRVIANHDHGELDLVEVTLTSGETVRCTWDHKFRTIETGEMLPLWLIQERNLSIVVNDANHTCPSL